MEVECTLQVIDTGYILKRELVPLNKLKTLKYWQIIWQRRLLRYKRTKPEHKQAIEEGNVVACWSNFDAFKQGGGDVLAVYTILFKGYDTYFESYYRS